MFTPSLSKRDFNVDHVIAKNFTYYINYWEQFKFIQLRSRQKCSLKKVLKKLFEPCMLDSVLLCHCYFHWMGKLPI